MNFRSLVFFILFLYLATSAAAQRRNGTGLWQTLDGNAPLVIARGGFSGLFADSSSGAYQIAGMVSLPNLIVWCDVQLTKDAVGVCFPHLNLQNGSNIASVYPNESSTYRVNGVPTEGWFSSDFTLNDLSNIFLTQQIFSRPPNFDGNAWPVLTIDDLVNIFAPPALTPGLWLNIEHDAFFSQHNLSMRSFVLSVLKTTPVDYISSPEVNFLKGLLARKPVTTKLVFRFLGQNEIEQSTNQTHGSLIRNLTFIKTFASAILVPKNYILPVDAQLYLLPSTSVVLDAHKAGLQVFASDFANDNVFAYDYSYDPLAEYLSFIDNGNFSVDGVLSDFPITPSAAIDCFSHVGKNVSGQAKPLIISNGGSSGDYPAFTDKAYAKAITDGANIIDCQVQMTNDGVPICLSSVNLIDSTNVVQSSFTNLTSSIPELQIVDGIFTFSLTWSQIQTLSPAISNPESKYFLYRNPKAKNDGKFMALSDFLALANNATTVSGVMIIVENAAYLAEGQGLDVTNAVLDTLKNSSYTKTKANKVMIQSSNSSFLIKMKDVSSYERVYRVDENIRDADNSTILEIQNFADALVINKQSVFPELKLFLTSMSDVVQKLQAFKFPVYVEIFRNEFPSQAWDFFSDATVEINTYVTSAGIDGVITDFPLTAARYKKNKCLGLGSKTPNYMSPVQPGSLLQLITPDLMPPAEAPYGILDEADVAEPPLPPVTTKPTTSGTNNGSTTAAAAPGHQPNRGQPKAVGCVFISSMALLLAIVSLF
ncbi:glycerophosphodiester phosphodiesterase GDPDL3-like [Impatiens glandulifera]|uniref:glycerophosphodiester phosphodiesterase GDPDL3-like n=1 Tax=Impatiens glandulifera TaxID=253017 RepID=UPI001FB120B9|nr:glycerophosphodiester phosphodiesterase GDPDL3-like [Impatiens glandulifera]